MATAQINARIDAHVKAAGDTALASIGYSPTTAIRALWEFAGKNRYNSKKLRAVFSEIEGERTKPELDAETQAVIKRIEEGPFIIERTLREMGIDWTLHASCELSDDELLEEALYEKWKERGLL